MPPFRTKKEAFEWLSSGKKTIDVRKGKPMHGEFAVYLSGRRLLKRRIVKTESGCLFEVVRLDNFKQVIPSAGSVQDAVVYLCGLYGSCEGVFTAYHLAEC